MHIRTFRAANLQAALADIRQQMGPEASVLHTRQVRDGWMGWLGRTQVEVTAGLHGGPTDNEDGGTGTRRSRQLATSLQSDFQNDDASQPADVRSVNASESNGSILLSGVSRGAGQGGSFESSRYPAEPTPADMLGLRLMQAGVDEETVRRWMASASSFAAGIGQADSASQNEQRWREHLQRAVARELNLSGPIRTQPGDRHVVALVGPTGVGKTTTVAKLAAGFRIEARRRVGLLTIDTYRIAAVQQLKAYAEIMDLPMQVVEQPDQMQDALAALGDVDLVLIDTAGRSPRSDARIEQLTDFLRAAQPDETHLVLAATSSQENIRMTIEGFAPVRATAITLTKLDETPCTAAVLAALTGHGRVAAPALSYLTNGQQVPDDIAVADAAGLVTQLLPSMPTVAPEAMGYDSADSYESLHGYDEIKYGDAA